MACILMANANISHVPTLNASHAPKDKDGLRMGRPFSILAP